MSRPTMPSPSPSPSPPPSVRFGPATMTQPLEVGIFVHALDPMVEFYERGLGCREVRRVEIPQDVAALSGAGGPNTTVWLATTGGERIKLIRRRDSAAAPRPVPLSSRVGLAYLTFYVADLAGAARGLVEAGAGVVSVPEFVDTGRRQIAFYTDPEGNVVELVGDTSPAEGS